MALGGSQLFEDVGDVRGVHLREAVLLDLQADAAGWITVDKVDEVPRDNAGTKAAGDAIYRLFGAALKEAPDGTAHPNLDFGDAKREF